MIKNDEPLKWVSEAQISLFNDEAINAVNNNIKFLAEEIETTDLDKQRRDVIWTNKIKKIARFECVLHEKFNEICYSEYTYPAQERLFHDFEFEDYVDIYKKDMKKLTYDHLLHFLKKAKNGKDELKEFLRTMNIPFREGLWY